MKKKIILTILIAIVMAVSACTSTTPPQGYIEVTEFEIAGDNFEVVEDLQKKIPVRFTPANATNQNIFWSVANDHIATVDSNGVVTARSAGVTQITAESFCGEIVSKSTLTVVAPNRPVTGILINGEERSSIDVSRTSQPITISVRIVPTRVNNLNYTLTSSNEEVATVAPNGRLTYTGMGTAVITARSEEGGFEATLMVNVIANETRSVNADRARILGVQGAKPVYVRPVFTYTIVRDHRVRWTSSNPAVATVGEFDGRVTFLNPGTTQLSVVTYCGTFRQSNATAVTVVATNEIRWISTPADLQALQPLTQAQNNGLYMLANDIDMTGIDFTPIGHYESYTRPELNIGFTGVLDGNGFAIRNLSMNNSTNGGSDRNAGLFRFLRRDASVRNLSIIGGTITNGGIVGTIAGNNEGIIENVFIQNHFAPAALNWNGIVVGANSATGRIYNVLVNSTANTHGNHRSIAGRNSNFIQGVFVNMDELPINQLTGTTMGLVSPHGTASTTMDSAALSLEQLQQEATFANWSRELWLIEEGNLPSLR
ncbi:MAG: Ig-like domain-containing protein [Firmicutes bacterium]|nr:Ig-like domain-containing protein [Bacillota bacterium]